MEESFLDEMADAMRVHARERPREAAMAYLMLGAVVLLVAAIGAVAGALWARR